MPAYAIPRPPTNKDPQIVYYFGFPYAPDWQLDLHNNLLRSAELDLVGQDDPGALCDLLKKLTGHQGITIATVAGDDNAKTPLYMVAIASSWSIHQHPRVPHYSAEELHRLAQNAGLPGPPKWMESFWTKDELVDMNEKGISDD